MSNELIIYPTEKLSKKNKSIFFNNLIKQNINKNILKNLNYEIVEPYGLESSLIKNNFDKLEEVYNKFIKELTVQLNELHLENKSERYWSIILGAWLRDLIWTTYNRYSSIQQTFKKNEINSILTIDDTKYNPVSEEVFDFMSNTNDLLFDAILINKILDQTKYKNKINKILSSKDKSFLKFNPYFLNFNPKKKQKLYNQNFFKKNLKKLFKFFRLFKNENDAFIINSGLSFYQEITLQIKLKQFPQYWEIPKVKYSPFEKNLRDKIRLKIKEGTEFEIIVSNLIPHYLPLSVLENYKKILLYCKKISWPKKPKFIFTSNAFGSKGIFQFWLANKVNEGFDYFVGQHGLGYLELNEKKYNIEYKTSDKFFSWGNFNFDKKIIPLFNLKIVGKKQIKNQGDKLIIVTRSSGNRTVPYDRFAYGNLLNKKTLFLLDNLDEQIKKKTILRLHDNYTEGLYEELDNFLKKNTVVTINQNTNYFKLIKQGKLVLFNDISSGFLHNITINVPSICYLPIGLNFIHDENKADYSKLINHKLMFDDMSKLTTFINSGWKDLNRWWNSPQTNQVRNEFCLKYSIHPPKNAIKKFSDVLTRNINQKN